MAAKGGGLGGPGYALDPHRNPEVMEGLGGGGGVNSKAMQGYIDIGMKVLDRATKSAIPKVMFQQCSGILLISAAEIGLIFSGQQGSGVALAHKNSKEGDDDKKCWSNPIAISIGALGVGAVLGFAVGKEIIVFLNALAMEKFLQGDGSFNMGAEFGFAAGKFGHAAAVALGISNKGGLASSFVYTFNDGVLIAAEVVFSSRVGPYRDPMEKFYGTSNHSDILDGKCAPPEGSAVPALLEKLASLESGPDVGAAE